MRPFLTRTIIFLWLLLLTACQQPPATPEFIFPEATAADPFAPTATPDREALSLDSAAEIVAPEPAQPAQPSPTWTPFVIEVTATFLPTPTPQGGSPVEPEASEEGEDDQQQADDDEAPDEGEENDDDDSDEEEVEFPVVDLSLNQINQGNLAEVNIQAVPIADGLTWPVVLRNAEDGSNRLFAVGRQGDIHIIQNGRRLDEVFLDHRPSVRSGKGPEGMWGLAFHPDFENNDTFFVSYTNNDGHLVIERMRVDEEDPNRADRSTGEVILEIKQYHQSRISGYLAFGPDGYLYIGTGDGGVNFDLEGPQPQDPLSWYGKILRIDVNNTSGGRQYAIPEDNPYVGNPAGLDEVWHLGLRRPAAFSWNQELGVMFVSDAGADGLEEINAVPINSRDHNFGWPIYDGFVCHFDRGGLPCDPEELTFPISGYPQVTSEIGDIIGGHTYRGSLFENLQGVYVYGDMYRGELWGVHPDDDFDALETTYIGNVALFNSHMGVGDDGEIFFTSYHRGEVWMLIDANDPDAPR